MKTVKIPSVEIIRCLPDGEDNAKSFSQIYRIFEDTSTGGASKTEFRACLHELCQAGAIQQNATGFYQLPDAKHPAHDIEVMKSPELTPTQRRKKAEEKIANARRLLHEALLLLDNIDL